MLVKIKKSLERYATVAAGGLLVIVWANQASGQNQNAAPTRERSANQIQQSDRIRPVPEQDIPARRTANQLNRDARQEARQRATADPGTAGEQSASLARASQGNAGDMNTISSSLRAADLGVWFNASPGANGLVVADLVTQGAFAQAGILEGDQIISINGQPVTSEAQFVQWWLTPGVGNQPANVVVVRNGQQQVLAIQSSAVMQEVASYDPIHQTGVMLDDRDPNRIVIQRVFPRTPAFYAGLRAGDVITGINGQQISTAEALTQALQTGAAQTWDWQSHATVKHGK